MRRHFTGARPGERTRATRRLVQSSDTIASPRQPSHDIGAVPDPDGTAGNPPILPRFAMLTPESLPERARRARQVIFRQLGGELAAIDLWTRVDSRWLHAGAAMVRDAVGYRGLPTSYRVAGVTIGDADAAPYCPPFLVQILDDRLSAQALWPRSSIDTGRLMAMSTGQLKEWSSGSLTKDMRVVRFEDGEIGLEADLHLDARTGTTALREFVTAFSWDVAALHAGGTDGALRSTEAWISRAALSISRSTPRIPLRERATSAWRSFTSPQGVFCSLQPSGGICASDNVLYAVSRTSAALEPVAIMPGHRNDWDMSRLVDIWLTRDGGTCLARTLLCEGHARSRSGDWRKLDSDAISTIAPWGDDGFLLGLHDGRVAIVDGDQVVGRRCRIATVSGRFTRLVTVADRAIGLVGTTLCSARLPAGLRARQRPVDMWSVSLDAQMAFDLVFELDVDTFSESPAVAVLGDDLLLIVDAETGATRALQPVHGARQARWIGPGSLLLVFHAPDCEGDPRSHMRMLDVASGRWTAPVSVQEVSRIAVRGDEIHVGFANLSVAVWDRDEVCRGMGAWGLVAPAPPNPVQVATPADVPRHRQSHVARARLRS